MNTILIEDMVTSQGYAISALNVSFDMEKAEMLKVNSIKKRYEMPSNVYRTTAMPVITLTLKNDKECIGFKEAYADFSDFGVDLAILGEICQRLGRRHNDNEAHKEG